jgi:hypothetical protein
MLYMYLLCVHTLNTNKNPFQSKQSEHFHQKNWFTQCETDSNKVKLPKIGSNAIVSVPVEGRAQQKHLWRSWTSKTNHFRISDLQNQPKLAYTYDFKKTCKDKTL